MEEFDAGFEFEDPPLPPIDLSALNPEQREAVEQVDGPLLILAGPGSGKTRVVTHRIAHLLSLGVSEHQILGLTFTNKAADEMKARIRRMAPGASVWISTFHRFCSRLLREHAALVGLAENFSILDVGDSRKILTEVLDHNQLDPRSGADKLADKISRAKNNALTPEEFAEQAGSGARRLEVTVYPLYQEALRAANAVDFDDLLLYASVILRDYPELRRTLDAHYQYVMVDEYQDTNVAQYHIVRALSIDYPNLAVTGDPDQSIYGWRGANLSNILEFEKDFPNANVVRLEQNYRSTPNILRVADALIRNNTRRKEKALRSDAPPGAAVRLQAYPNYRDEAADIAHQIAEQIENGRSPKEIAIFYRVHSLSRVLEHALLEQGVPYQILHGAEFYQRKEIKDLLAYLHLINNPRNTPALLRIINMPPRGIGKRTLECLKQHADTRRIGLLKAAREAGIVEGLTKRAAVAVARFVALYDKLREHAQAEVEEIMGRLLTTVEYEEYLQASDPDDENDRVANVRELLNSAREFDEANPEGGGLEKYLEQVSLASDTDDWEKEIEKISLMTLHSCKGLEFDSVYIVALENGYLPHERSRQDPLELEEERRLLFVGITRARQDLRLSMAQYRARRGALAPTVPSAFLMELPREEMDLIQPAAPSRYSDLPPRVARPAAASATSAAALEPGPRVMTAAEMMSPTEPQRSAGPAVSPEAFEQGMVVSHPEYGAGTIIALSGSATKRMAKVRFFSSGEEHSFRLAFSELRPIASPDA